jgi:hypothetical protein
MARKCIVCAHESRKEIDKMLVEPNAQYSAISRMFFGSDKQRDALRRHVENGHIIAKIKKIASAHEALEANDFIGHLQGKRTRFKEMAKAAQTDMDPHLELKIYQVESKFIELEGKALGAFKGDKPNNPADRAGALTDAEVMERARRILSSK